MNASLVIKQTLFYMQKIEGLVETNKGLGQITVKECDEHGNIAQTLYQLALKKNSMTANCRS